MPHQSELGQRRRADAEPIPVGHKLLFPHIELINAAIVNSVDGANVFFGGITKGEENYIMSETERLAFDEYEAIFVPLFGHIGPGKVALLRNRQDAEDDNLSDSALLGGIETQTLRLSSYYENHQYWPRDFFTTIAGVTLYNPYSTDQLDGIENVIPSIFGEGGSVIHANNAMLADSTAWKDRSNDQGYRILREQGIIMTEIPSVIPQKQAYPVVPGHIDGHAALIVDRAGKTRLYAAQSYVRQDRDTLRKVQQAAHTIGAKLEVVNDAKLPPLPLNLVQFEDGTVFVTKTADGSLEKTLAKAVGQEQVLTTNRPIRGLPKLTRGSIRCMINMIPESILRHLAA